MSSQNDSHPAGNVGAVVEKV
ncbi:MAG: hypothetical protein QOK15_687, partial [Nocardioidaceae bacterium]|nr:hypothetical protein [Nocardioidaceae bacterium]